MTLLLRDLSDVEMAPNKHYSTFIPSLEDQGWFEAKEVEMPGMMTGMGKRPSWGVRSNLPWAKRWLTAGILSILGKRKKLIKKICKN